MKLFQTHIRFLGHDIHQGTIRPITRVLEFTSKFLDEIKDKTQLQRFLGCLNYVSDFFKELRILFQPLFNHLKKNPKPWSQVHTETVKTIKRKF